MLMRNSTWPSVSRREPCVVCGKTDWCARSADGCWALCRRIDSGAGIHCIDKSGGDYFLYSLTDDRPERPAIDLPIRQSPERADVEMLHRIYNTLIDNLTLSSLHRDNLRRRGLPDDEITHRGYRTLPRHGRAELARRLVECYGAEVCSRVPGLYVRSEGRRQWWSLAGAAGLLIPLRDQAGHCIALMVRSDEADADPRYTFISSARHGGPGPLVGVHVPLHDGAHGGTVRLTEGIMKSDVTTNLDGMLTLGLSAGVGSWRQALPVLRTMKVTTVRIAFDADARANVHVARALQGCVRELMAAGFEVQLEVWDETTGKGIDDVLAAWHQPDVLKGQAMREEIRAAVRSAAWLDPAQMRQRLA
jgi:hypothetical protein